MRKYCKSLSIVLIILLLFSQTVFAKGGGGHSSGGHSSGHVSTSSKGASAGFKSGSFSSSKPTTPKTSTSSAKTSIFSKLKPSAPVVNNHYYGTGSSNDSFWTHYWMWNALTPHHTTTTVVAAPKSNPWYDIITLFIIIGLVVLGVCLYRKYKRRR